MLLLLQCLNLVRAPSVIVLFAIGCRKHFKGKNVYFEPQSMPRTATRREEDDDEVQVFLREPLAQLSQESSFYRQSIRQQNFKGKKNFKGGWV